MSETPGLTPEQEEIPEDTDLDIGDQIKIAIAKTRKRKERVRQMLEKKEESFQKIVNALGKLKLSPNFFKKIIEKIGEKLPRIKDIKAQKTKGEKTREPSYKETTEIVCIIEEELSKAGISKETKRGKEIIDTIKIAISVRYRFMVKYKNDLEEARKQRLGIKEIFSTVIKDKILEVLNSYKRVEIISEDEKSIKAKLSNNKETPVEFELSIEFPALFISIEKIRDRKGETLRLIEILNTLRTKHHIRIPILILSEGEQFEDRDLLHLIIPAI